MSFLQHHSADGETDRAQAIPQKQPLELFWKQEAEDDIAENSKTPVLTALEYLAKWQTEGRYEKFHAFCVVPDELVDPAKRKP